jgi:hypothetical protein
MSVSTMAQGVEITERLKRHSRPAVQKLIDNFDLVEALMKGDPDRIDRQAFSALMTTPAPGSYDRHRGLLLSLNDQLNKLIDLNERFWGGVLTPEEFTALDLSSDHVQSVDDLEILYVDFGSPEQNVEMWWKVIAGIQPRASRWDGLSSDPEHLRLAPNTYPYNPGMRGIYRVRINLVANWQPQDGRSVLQVREWAARSGEYLAHAEVLAAYGLHDELLRQQDGTNLPYSDMAGFEASIPGRDPWTHCPYLRWNGGEAKLFAGWVGDVSRDWSAPVVWES